MHRKVCSSFSGAQVRLLLVVEDGISREDYCRELDVCGVEVVAVENIFPVPEAIADQRFNGLLLDIKAKMKAIRHSRAEVYRLTARFPTALLQHDMHTRTVRIFHPGRGPTKCLSDFVDKHCRHHHPQKLRSFPRKQAYLPVLLTVSDTEQRPRRLVTKDISPGGCFLVSFQSWKLGERVRLSFVEDERLRTILAEVKRMVCWGEGRELPGVGVEFVELTQEQEFALQDFCNNLEGRNGGGDVGALRLIEDKGGLDEKSPLVSLAGDKQNGGVGGIL